MVVARPSTAVLGAPRSTSTAGAKAAKASRRPHMAGSRARTHWSRGGRWARLFLLRLRSPPPLPAAAARPPTAGSLASDPGAEGLGGEGRGGREGRSKGRAQAGRPGSSHPPTLPSSPLPSPFRIPPRAPASLGLCPLPSQRPQAPWILLSPVSPSRSGYLLCTMPGAGHFTRGLQSNLVSQTGKLRLRTAN